MFFSVKHITFIFFLLITFSIQAQDPLYFQYTTNDGLPSNEVYDVEVDQNGLVWFTTDRGVSTYNGYTFKNYTTQDGLADNTNFEIYRDSKSRLWFNGFNQRLSIYENGHFRAYLYNDTIKKIVPDDAARPWISYIVEGKEGYYFVIEAKWGISIYQFKNNRPPKELSQSILKDAAFFFEHNDDTHTTLVSFNDIGFSFHSLRSSSIPGREALKHKNDWVYYDWGNIYKYNIVSKKNTSYAAKGLIGHLYIDAQLNIWVGTTNGLFLFKNGDFSQAPSHFFKGTGITAIQQDKERNYWVTTSSKGIFLIPSFDIKSTSEQTNVLSIGKLKEHIVFGTADGKIISINKNKQLKPPFQSPKANIYLRVAEKWHN